MYSHLKNSVKVLLILMSLYSGIIFAQNYKPVKTDATYYFYDSISKEIIAARIDSTAIVGSENQYFGMRQIRQTDFSCWVPNGASWLGDLVTENPNGSFKFILNPFSTSDSADIFTINSHAIVGNYWHFYNYHTINDFVEAKVTQIIPVTFIGISDTVKTIILQRKDASGQNVIDPVNGQTILLSQNYGLIRLPKFDEFNTNLKFLDLCGKTNPVTGRTNLSFEEIFDFQPGDEFHIDFDDLPYSQFYPWERGLMVQRIIERINGSNTDTVSYRIAECKTTTFSSGMNEETIINLSDTILVTYIKANYPALANDPKEPQISDGWEMELTENKMGLSTTNVLDQAEIPWKQTNAIWPLWSNDQLCWYYAIIDGYEKAAFYYKGLGGPYHYWMTGWLNTNYRRLIYYKKGSETWGTPLDCETLLHVGLPENLKNQNINIFPNPTSGLITVSVPERRFYPYKIELFDISGRLAKEFIMSTQSQVFDLGNLPAGMYTAKVIGSNGTIFNAKIVKH